MAVMVISSHKLYYSVISHGTGKVNFWFSYATGVLDTSYLVKDESTCILYCIK